MRCPKCHQEQNSTVECELCGVIFARYQQVQERRQQVEAEKAEASGKRRLPLLVSLALLVVLVAGATYYFTVTFTQSPAPVAQTPAEPTPPIRVEEPAARPEKVVTAKVAPPTAEPQLAGSSASAIERAKNATVSIETPWGHTGYGDPSIYHPKQASSRQIIQDHRSVQSSENES